jgi:HTH-type transcriptional regulator/antitoxin HipB
MPSPHLILTSIQVGRLLQSARKAHKYSQTALASRLGMSQARLSALELNPGHIRVDQLLKMCANLGLELLIQKKGEPTGDGSTPPEW